MLAEKKLWLARADLLGDPWEVALSRAHFDNLRMGGLSEENARALINIERTRTCVNCWSASDHESHALWRIYCGQTEGVAVQTTLKRLRRSVEPWPIRVVRYQESPNIDLPQPAFADLVTVKRPMFAYEREVRVVRFQHDPDIQPPGHALDWNPELVIERIFTHPNADDSFRASVAIIVKAFAPALCPHLRWSAL